MGQACKGKWESEETAGCIFPDQRLKKRFEKMLADMAGSLGKGLSMACQDWANTKAAYRFLSNSRVSEKEILGGHFQATRTRFQGVKGTVLVLHDTSEFSFKRTDPESIGFVTSLPCDRAFGREVKSCGILMHSSLAVTPSGLPLGLAAVKFWTRKQFKGTNALKRHINPTRVDIKKKESIRWLENLEQSTTLLGDPQRCVHIGDRESDIYELFCLAAELKSRFLFRTCVDRVAGDGTTLVSKILAKQPVRGVHRLTVINARGEQRDAELEVKFTPLELHPPVYKKRAFPNLTVTVIEARERGRTKKSDAILWKLVTNMPIQSLASAIEKLQWYACRWKIETFHKILKSGCRAEESRLRTAERLVNLIAICSVLSWRVFWITTLRRESPQARASSAFTELEIALLDRLSRSSTQSSTATSGSLDRCILQIAVLGGYLARASDPPPGNLVIWRGLSRLNDIQLGFDLQC